MLKVVISSPTRDAVELSSRDQCSPGVLTTSNRHFGRSVLPVVHVINAKLNKSAVVS